MNISFGNFLVSGATVDNVLAFHMGHTDLQYSLNIISIQTNFSNTTDWTNVTVTVSNMSTSPLAEMFVNGVSVGTDGGSTFRTDRVGWNTNLRFGRAGAAERYFDGALDEIRITNTDVHLRMIVSISASIPISCS
ncbi:hypothetical protein ES703_121606 [subsurface metagenome]